MLMRLEQVEGLLDDVTDVRGWPVLDATGRRVGHIEDLLLDVEEEHVCCAIAEIDHRRFLMPIEGTTFDEDRHRVLAHAYSHERLLGLPAYTGGPIDAGHYCWRSRGAEGRIARIEERLANHEPDREPLPNDDTDVAIKPRRTVHVRLTGDDAIG